MGTPIRHPLIDQVSRGVVRVDSRAPVVRLSGPLADLLSRPVQGGRRIALVTPTSSRITFGLRSALVAAGAVWAVARDGGGYRDVLSGAGAATLEGLRRGGAVPETGADGPDREHDGGRSDDSALSRDGRDRGGDGAVQLSVDMTLLHPSRPAGGDAPAARLGGALETISSAIGLGTPRAWGRTEPLEHPWDRGALTAAADTGRLLVEGEGYSATVVSRPAGRGREETLALTADIPGEAPQIAAAIARVGDALADLARRVVPTFALVVARTGARDRTFGVDETPTPNPVALLLGAPAVRRLRLAADVFAPGQEVVTVGRADRPAFLLPLGSAAEAGWERLRDALDSIGGDRLGALLAQPLVDAWEDDLHGDLDLHGEPHPHTAAIPLPESAGTEGRRPDAP